ncbi:MAG: electron transport complex subunit RsxG [Gammaproteobacteria bacterium]|nr:electron transport complex subunit RsxG [Gammaproteobacteria bacterium]MBT8104238.1 electron transport complex subunit RsxG [Gammaproteobacteria bacterium]NNF49077.1 electron transport complex subunit RsxG [Woeseiaceae bacterium]NNK24253.1 electron transport complex subunit RsxG [Woeseiaceae bacterium]NNL63860.1 electron transport complex subunit RsxG [Woeseiaceae bacterium]
MAEASIVRDGITLAAIAAVCTALVAATYTVTDERIAANQQAWLERSLQPVLAGLSFDSGVSESRLTIPAPHALPGSDDATVYRVYAQQSPVAALYVVSARDGYAGAIRLLVGVAVGGEIAGVHVLAHRETPGLGDLVETSKSDWVRQFDGRSLADPNVVGWRIKRDGGTFDQLTGASVTPRAIVKAVRQTLEYHAVHADAVFAAPSDDEETLQQ